MKKNKFLLVSVLFIAIFLVQPQNFQSLKSAFTQNDIATQLNISDSPEEKNGDLSNAHQTQNEKLKSKTFDFSLIEKMNSSERDFFLSEIVLMRD